MIAIITFKNDTKLSPARIVNILAILTTTYTIKFVQRNNRVQAFENCDIENIFLQYIKKNN